MRLLKGVVPNAVVVLAAIISAQAEVQPASNGSHHGSAAGIQPRDCGAVRPAKPEKVSSPTLTFTLLNPDRMKGSQGDLSVQALDGPWGPWTMPWKPEPVGVTEIEAERWSHGRGRYRLTSRIGARRFQADFTVSEQDLAIAVTMTWVERGGRQLLLLPVEIEHTRPSDDTVTLLRCWTPTPGGKARYLLSNHRKGPIFGAAMGGNFFGSLSRWSGAWEPFFRGVSCAAVGTEPPVPSGGFVESNEDIFVGKPQPLTPGRYRYGVSYAVEPKEQVALPADTRDGETPVAEHVHYELSDTFELR
jgi:hypothetical protein